MDYTFDAAGIEKQRILSDRANQSLYSDEQEAAQNTIVCVAYDAALDEIERLLPFEADNAALRAQVERLTRERDADKETIRLLEGDKYNSELNLQTLVEQLDAEKKRTDAAISDLKYLSGEYKLCDTCKRNHGKGVWDCNDGLCDKENHYEWRGPCAADQTQEGDVACQEN